MHSAQASGVTHAIVESSANQAFGSHSQWRAAYGGKVSSLDSSYIIPGSGNMSPISVVKEAKRATEGKV